MNEIVKDPDQGDKTWGQIAYEAYWEQWQAINAESEVVVVPWDALSSINRIPWNTAAKHVYLAANKFLARNPELQMH